MLNAIPTALIASGAYTAFLPVGKALWGAPWPTRSKSGVGDVRYVRAWSSETSEKVTPPPDSLHNCGCQLVRASCGTSSPTTGTSTRLAPQTPLTGWNCNGKAIRWSQLVWDSGDDSSTPVGDGCPFTSRVPRGTITSQQGRPYVCFPASTSAAPHPSAGASGAGRTLK